MIGAGKDKITIRIHNKMKRSSDRDTPPRSKRSRSSMGRYEDSSDERVSPDRGRRRRSRSPSPRPRFAGSPHRGGEEYMRSSTYPYKVLGVSALHPKASDELIKDTLYREYKKYGDLTIRIGHDLDERVAYVCFRSSDDARDAKHGKPRIIIYDKVALVDPVYDVPRPAAAAAAAVDPYRRPRSITPEYDRHYYARSPGPDRLRQLDRYERAYGPPPGVVHRGDPYRRDVLPVAHDYLARSAVHHLSYGGGGPRGSRVPQGENKKDKFPNYLHHVSPEDDPLSTRTLFSGNLEINITEEELRRIFSRYGVVEDIDIKRPPPGTGNAFAFVRFQTLDMAHRAKVELSGQYIGKFQCKIGYGKVTPTTRIWVGGLGPWTSVPQLEREFDRFGAIKKIDYVKGDNQAYILYDSIDAATAAVKEMRGFALGGPERRLRTDFADVNPAPAYHRPKAAAYPGYEEYGELRREYEYDAYMDDAYGRYPGRGGYADRGRYRYPEGAVKEEWAARRLPEGEFDRRRSISRAVDRSPRSRSPRRSPDSDSDAGCRRAGLLASSRTLPEVARKCSTIWQGALILKNSLFPAKFHLIDGDTDIVDGLMKDEEGKHQLRITQRLRLDQPKLEDVQKRISSATSHAIFLGLAGSTTLVTNDDVNVQTRPLRNLVSYLKQKEAAGVISLLNKETEATGVLYSFPPCPFSTELLKRTCPNLSDEAMKEDHLIVVVVRGGTA